MSTVPPKTCKTGRYSNGRAPLSSGRPLTDNEQKVLEAARLFRATGRRASVSPLSLHLGICQGTVSRVLARLEAAGLVESREPLEGTEDLADAFDPPPPTGAEIAAACEAIRAGRCRP